jgi:phage tail-like protein
MASTGRNYPYSAFNFQVNWGQTPGPDTLLGGFSDVSGLNTEIHVSEYRVGNEALNHVRKVPGLYKQGDVTLKRGVVNSMDFYKWISDVRTNGTDGQKTVTVTLFDESQKPVQKWVLYNAIPMKYTGPTLAATKGDLAVEEIVLSVENFEIRPGTA